MPLADDRRVARLACARGMTLLEVLVSLGDARDDLAPHLRRVRLAVARTKGEALRADRARQGATRWSASRTSSRARSSRCTTPHEHRARHASDRVHRAEQLARSIASTSRRSRIGASTKDAKESDQAEIGYFVVKDPDVDEKMDLVRREQAPIDFDSKRAAS